jgi:hypothetical protein
MSILRKTLKNCSRAILPLTACFRATVIFSGRPYGFAEYPTQGLADMTEL